MNAKAEKGLSSHSSNIIVYFGGQLKAIILCPFFLYLAHVNLDIQRGAEGGLFLDLFG